MADAPPPTGFGEPWRVSVAPSRREGLAPLLLGALAYLLAVGGMAAFARTAAQNERAAACRATGAPCP